MASKLTERNKNNRNVPLHRFPVIITRVRASRIVRTRYFNENWLQLAATTLIVDGSPEEFLALESRCARARCRNIAANRDAGRPLRRKHAGASARLFSSWKIVKDRRALPCPASL